MASPDAPLSRAGAPDAERRGGPPADAFATAHRRALFGRRDADVAGPTRAPRRLWPWVVGALLLALVASQLWIGVRGRPEPPLPTAAQPGR